jgi:hypothetical protein
MRKYVVLLLLMMLLVACGTSEVPEPTEPANAENGAPTAVSESSTGEKSSSGAPPAVTGDAITAAETAAEASVLRDRDWTKGAEDPLVTIIEYGDFQ